MKKSYLVDVPVALFFFSRPLETSQVFEQIKKARPSKLFLIQDGAREGNKKDVENVLLCREIVDDIDWECEVHRNYSDVNLGCGGRVSSGMQWAFNYVDRLVKLEDDSVPSISWLSFCSVLLEKYKDDYRIGSISGVNQIGKYDGCGDDYIFATVGSVAAFATWKRVWDEYDYNLKFADSEYYINLLKKNIYPSYIVKGNIRVLRHLISQSAKGMKRTSWSAPFGYAIFLNSQLIIVPRVNMITNVGLSEGATNGGTTIHAIPKRKQIIFNAARDEVEFPLRHPKYIIEDKIYNDKVQYIMKGGKNPLSRLALKIESGIRIILVRHLKILK